jgi:hypothetical protein
LKNKYTNVEIGLIIAGVFALANYLRVVFKKLLLEPNFADFAHYYFKADLLNQGINFLRLDQQTIDSMMAASAIPVKIAVGPAGATIYSPAFYAFVMPIAKLDFNNACLIWFVLNHIALIISILFLIKVADLKINVVTLSSLMLIVFIYQPLIEDVSLGQSNILLLCMLVLTLWAMMSTKTLLAGLFMAIVILIKVQYGFILLLFLIKRLYKPFLYTIFFYCLISGISIFVVGEEFFIDYFPALINAGIYGYTDHAILWYGNKSLISLLAKLLNGVHLDVLRFIHVVLALGAILYAVKLLWRLYHRELFPLEFTLWLMLSFLITSFLEIHYLVILYLPIFVVYSKINYLSKLWQYIFIFGFILLGVGFESYTRFEMFHSGSLRMVTHEKLYGLMLLFATVFYCYKKVKGKVTFQG